MSILGVTLGTLVIIILLAIFLATFFMWLGAKMAGVKKSKSNFSSAFLSAVGVGLVTWLFGWLASLLHIYGLIGLIIGLILAVLVIKHIYDIPFGRAFLVWLFNIFAQALAIFIAFLIFGSSILMIFK